MLNKIVTFAVMLLFIGMCIPSTGNIVEDAIPCNETVYSTISNEPPAENIYLEDVKILLSGRCRTVGWIGNWNWKWFQIGYFRCFDVLIGATWIEKANIIVYNKTIVDPYISFSGLTRTYVLVWNATGIFYYSGWMGDVGKIPWRIFFHCHADRLWIREFN